MNTDKEKSAFVHPFGYAQGMVHPRQNDLLNRQIEQIAARFESKFLEQLRPRRKIGREAEFPVITRDGRAADVINLLHALLEEGGFTPRYDDPERQTLLIAVERADLDIAVESGQCTIELTLRPCDDLWELQKVYDTTLALVTRVAASRGMDLLGFGIQPRARASRELMTPRLHYRALYNAMGAPWLKLTTTAADQTHVDICRTELLDAINYMNLLSAPLVALCANSSVYAGRAGKYLSGRESALRELGELRYGMTPRKFESVEEFIRYLCEYECFILPETDGYRKFNRPFTNHLLTHIPTHPNTLFDTFLFHEHYVWNSARARVANSTIEVRPACQQPREEPFAANALILGWVESLPDVAAYFENTFGDDAWRVMRAFRCAAVREGLKAKEPAPQLIRDLVRLAQAGLAKRGRGEEKFLAPVWERFEKRESPGIRARRIFQRKGMEGLLKEIVIR